MSDPKYIRDGFAFNLAHAVEEAGEFLAAAGKTARWGLESYNPDLAPEQRETNEAWIRREMKDLRDALDRLEREIAGVSGAVSGAGRNDGRRK